MTEYATVEEALKASDKEPMLSVLAKLSDDQLDRVNICARLLLAGWTMRRVGGSGFVTLTPPKRVS